MFSIVAGSTVTEDELKALRILCAEQFKEIVERNIRDEFIGFYQNEIVKARKMGMALVKD